MLVDGREHLRVGVLAEDLRRLGEVGDDGQECAAIGSCELLAGQATADLEFGAQFTRGLQG